MASTHSDDAYAAALRAALALPADAQACLIAALEVSLTATTTSTGTEGHTATTYPLEGAASDQRLLVSNGLDADSGRPRFTLGLPQLREQLRVSLGARSISPKTFSGALYAERHRADQDAATYSLIAHLDANDLARAGWGLIVHADDDAELIVALAPLIAWRMRQQQLTPPSFEINPGETCEQWLLRQPGARPFDPWDRSGPPIFLFQRDEAIEGWLKRRGLSLEQIVVDPTRGLPYYLLIAARPGAPDGKPAISFDVQHTLDLAWAVGRVCFTDAAGRHRLDAYARYAEGLIAQEEKAAPKGRCIGVFAPHSPEDQALQISHQSLVKPLMQALADPQKPAGSSGFTIVSLLAEQATRANLLKLLGLAPQERPALLLTVSHGITYPSGDVRQIEGQGALICQSRSGQTPDDTEALRAEHLPADLSSMVAECVACHSVGCPEHDQFALELDLARPVVAPFAFVSQLAQGMLERGALAVIGHVDDLLTASFHDGVAEVGEQSQAFEDLLWRLIRGDRIGYATDVLNQRQGASAANLALAQSWLRAPDPEYKLTEIGAYWQAFVDARGYTLLGDPAARINLP